MEPFQHQGDERGSIAARMSSAWQRCVGERGAFYRVLRRHQDRAPRRGTRGPRGRTRGGRRRRAARPRMPSRASRSKKRCGWPMPATACTRPSRPRGRIDAPRGSARLRHPARLVRHRRRRPADGARSRGASGGEAHDGVDRAQARRGSRSGPAGSRQPLPKPRAPSIDDDLDVAGERVVLQPVVAEDDVARGMRREQRPRGRGDAVARHDDRAAPSPRAAAARRPRRPRIVARPAPRARVATRRRSRATRCRAASPAARSASRARSRAASCRCRRGEVADHDDRDTGQARRCEQAARGRTCGAARRRARTATTAAAAAAASGARRGAYHAASSSRSRRASRAASAGLRATCARRTRASASRT